MAAKSKHTIFIAGMQQRCHYNSCNKQHTALALKECLMRHSHLLQQHHHHVIMSMGGSSTSAA
jgi:hypothetical protein